MTEMKFFLKCVPPSTTHQSKELGRTRNRRGKEITTIRDSSRLRSTITFLQLLLQQKRPKKPLEGPIALTLEYSFPFLKTARKRDTKRGYVWKVTKPDCSNTLKTFEDCLTRLRFINDDAEVVRVQVRKTYHHVSGIGVHLQTLSEYPEDLFSEFRSVSSDGG